jgi:5-methylcytosine-specific restriction endonuclease McrA
VAVRLCLGDPTTGERCSRRVVDASYCEEHDPGPRRSPSSRRTSRSRWQRLRRFAKRKAKVCERCGSSGPLDAHHVVPVSEGGRDVLSNVAVLCQTCHVEVERERRRKRVG